MPFFSGSLFMGCPDGISLAVTNALPGIMQLSFLRHAALHSAGSQTALPSQIVDPRPGGRGDGGLPLGRLASILFLCPRQ